jgi:hypothetical protein
VVATLPGIQDNAQREIEGMTGFEKLRLGGLLIKLVADVKKIPDFMTTQLNDIKKEIEEVKEV